MMDKSKSTESVATCPSCKSGNNKKRFLGIPSILGISPFTCSCIILIGGFLTIGSGYMDMQYIVIGSYDTGVPITENNPELGMIKYIVGAVLVILAVCSFIFKNYKCLACQKGFFWPQQVRSIKVKCPSCGVRLKGVDSDMIGDTAVCSDCKHEFEIKE